MAIFSNGLTHGFDPKMPIFPTFFLSNTGQENVFYDILERKNTFLGYQNKKFKKSKNGHCFKRVNPCFWSKNDHFSKFCLMQYRPGKCLLRYTRTKKHLSRLSKQEVLKTKNGHFFKRVNPCFWSKYDHFFNFFFGQYRPGKCLLRYTRTKKNPF